MHRYYAFHKPYGYLSQFSDEDGNPGLRKLLNLPKDVYPLGRLDKESEGLLLLTNDKSINKRLLDPKHQHHRTYWVQVDRQITPGAIEQLEKGVEIKVGKSKYITMPAKISEIEEPDLPDRNPPVRFRKSVPTSWIEMTLTEGKNRQVRKMCAAVGFPCLRLIRWKIEELTLENIGQGELVEITAGEFKSSLNL
jgi:23S rRNA pseudouridine2457 synthase